MNSPVEEIKARLDIVEFVQGYVRLHKAGINYKANCPFHGEKTPSFFVSPARQMWHCFGCGRGGDVFKFLMEIEGHDFPEALRMLAQRTGVEMRREDPRIKSERNLLYDINEEAARIFEKNLSLTPAVKAYLKNRGVADQTVNNFRIGFAPQNWDFLLKSLTEKGFRKEDIEKAGLAIKSEEGMSWYDRFRSRIMFPIADANGRVIGFGGRIFAVPSEALAKDGKKSSSAKAAEDVAKYVNTPATLVYDKSRVLYGFDRAKQEIRSQNRVVVVEGYMDCVMSHQAGVKYAVAVSGTALTSDQLKTLRRLSGTMIASFDTDAAGDSATKRSLALAAQFDFERRIVQIPSGKDPADAVAQDQNLWRQAVDAARPVVDFYFEKAFAEQDPKTVNGKKAICAMVLPFIVELSQEIEKAHWVSELSRRLQAPEESIWKDLRHAKTNEFIPQRREEETLAVGTPPRRRDLLEEHVLALLALASEEARGRELGKRDIEFISAMNGELYSALRRNGIAIAAHLEPHLAMLKFKSEILSQTLSDVETELAVSLHHLEIEALKDRRTKKSEELAQKERDGDQDAHDRILREIGEMNAKLTAIDKAPTPRFFAKRVL